MTGFLRNSDAFTWAMESDPRLRSTVVSVVLLDRSPDWDEVRERFDLISRKLPMFRQRVVPSPPPAPPRWEYAPDFDLDYHVRRAVAPGAGTLDDVLEMARLAEMQDFDRARALWETTLLDGLENGGAAMICKFHHALTDGIGGVQIAMNLFNLSEELYQREPLPPEPEVPRSSWLGGYRDTWRYDTGLLADALAGAVKAAPRLVYGGVRQPVATVRSAAATAASVYRTVRPISRTGSPLVTDRGLIRRLMVHQVPMPQLREAAHRCGGALNDAFVAGVAGGLRRYHEKHDVAIGDLHLSMPISLRTKADGVGGNRITLMRFDVPRVRPTRRRGSRGSTSAPRRRATRDPSPTRSGLPDFSTSCRAGTSDRCCAMWISSPAMCQGCRCRSSWAAPRCARNTRSARPSARRST
jgi:WS/DGAT/MGAT family acyltransferase